MALSLRQFADRFAPQGLTVLTDSSLPDEPVGDVQVLGLDAAGAPGRTMAVVLPLSLVSAARTRRLPEIILHKTPPAALLFVGEPDRRDTEPLREQCLAARIPLFRSSGTPPLEEVLSALLDLGGEERLARYGAHLSLALTKGFSMEEVLSLMQAWTGIDAAFRDESTGRVFVAAKDSLFDEHARTYPLRELSRIYPARPVSDGRRILGHLVVKDAPGDRASPYVGLTVSFLAARQYVESLQKEPQRALRHSLLRELLAEAPSDVRNAGDRLQRAGLDGGRLAAVAVVSGGVATRGGGRLPAEGLAKLEARLQAYFEECFLLTDDDAGVFVCVLRKGAEERAILHNLRQTLRNFLDEDAMPDLFVGIGELGRPLLRISESYVEALRALRLARSSGKGRILYWPDLGVDRVIAAVAENTEAVRYCGSLLRPLFAYDGEHGTDLAATILALEDRAWNVTAAAEALSVHYNTVKYRMDKALEILGIDRDNPRDRFALSLAVYIHRLGP
jgi:DNA-binding PucR family transcriptional regulator